MSESVSGEVIDLGALTPSALEVLQRAEIDVQISTAKRYPRSLDQFKKRATDMACIDQETAASCIYRRPVGKGDDGKQKIAEGMSIRMAEIVAASYGNIRSASRIIEQTDRFVKCQGVCHDLETNNSSSSEVIESTVDKYGKPYSERMRVVAAKACLAKAHRDAIFKVVPRALAKPIEAAAKAVIAGTDKGLAERRQRAREWVVSLKIDEARVFAVLDVKGWDDLTSEHLIDLTGLRTAIKDGETTVDEAFPVLGQEQQPIGPGTGSFKKPATSPAGPHKGEAAGGEKGDGPPAPAEGAPPPSETAQAPAATPTKGKKAKEEPAATPEALANKCVDEWFVKRGHERTREECQVAFDRYMQLTGKKRDAASLTKVLGLIEAGTVTFASYDTTTA